MFSFSLCLNSVIPVRTLCVSEPRGTHTVCVPPSYIYAQNVFLLSVVGVYQMLYISHCHHTHGVNVWCSKVWMFLKFLSTLNVHVVFIQYISIQSVKAVLFSVLTPALSVYLVALIVGSV